MGFGEEFREDMGGLENIDPVLQTKFGPAVAPGILDLVIINLLYEERHKVSGLSRLAVGRFPELSQTGFCPQHVVGSLGRLMTAGVVEKTRNGYKAVSDFEG
jgi:hypothetical protein